MSAAPVRILVVDDEPPIRRLLRTGLGSQGYDVTEAADGRAAEAAIARNPDLVLLDLGLPDVAGHDLLRGWRSAGLDAPIIVLSSRTDEAGIVEALELGADDYVTKPFGMKELVARIRTALRHRLQEKGELPVFHSGDLTVDLVHRIVRLGDVPIDLTPREYEVLRVLVQHAGKVLTHQFLIRQVWGGAVDVQNLRVVIRQLRQKLEPDPQGPGHIRTETGVGYRLQPSNDTAHL
jgi:two-component system, OmpR family, KDP operon response regulator KdpE